jgi:sarcosine oxidase
MKTDFKAIVVGLGGIGAAAAYWLARRLGGEVLGLEQFEIGHARGASQDHSRIIRLSYHTPAYVGLAKEAYAAWAVLEAEAGESLIIKTGGLDLAPRGSAVPLTPYVDSLRACGVPFELLDAAEVMRRWPSFRLSDDVQCLYQAAGGIAPAARCNAAHLRLAQRHGAVLRYHVPVTSIRPRGEEMEVAANKNVYRCQRLVIAADAWCNAVLAHLGLKLALTVTQEQVTYFATPHLADYQPDRFPVWIWLDDPCFYGFPVYGEAGTKAAQDVGGHEVTAETRTFTPNPASLERVRAFLAKYLPSALGPIIATRTCLYTLTPDRDFVLGSLPGYSNAFMALGAGHGFKFASLFGKILSELALDGQTSSDIRTFRFDRPVLHMADPPRQFMV